MQGHSGELRSVAEPADLRFTISARPVPDGKLDDLQILLGCAEEQVEIAERIEVTEERSRGGDPLVVAPEQHLRPAERVLQPLLQDRRESLTEELVPHRVEEAHRLAFHRIDES